MVEYLKMGVKPLIDAFPEVGTVLERYGIGCVQCTVGTCKLEDVVSFHTLPPQDEAEMMFQVERAIDPEKISSRLIRPRLATKRPSSPEIGYSPPVRRLVDEHEWIKRLLARIPDILNQMRDSGEIDSDLLLTTIDFIRGYADRFHHMKEEDILLAYADKDAQIVQVILEDHDRARSLVRATVGAIEDGDPDAVSTNLMDYRALLTEHITKEDGILFPYIDRGLTISQVGEIFRRFEEVESEMADDIPRKYVQFIISLADRFPREDAVE